MHAYIAAVKKPRTDDDFAIATVTRRGQATIPRAVRDAARLKAGDRIHFTVLHDGTILVRAKNRSIHDIAVKPPRGRRVSTESMSR
jgi:AbrB family looped-hinge helix DNA binding protein